MQVQKINDNKLEIILDSSDLLKNNIKVDSFLSNSAESQDFLEKILSTLENNYNFNIENSKAIIETICLDTNLFILTITKIENKFLLKDSTSPLFIFYSLENVFELYYFASKKKFDINNFYIYKFLNLYFIFYKNSNLKIHPYVLEYANTCSVSADFKNILLEHGTRVNLK